MRRLTLNVRLVFDYLRMTENPWAADSRNWNKFTLIFWGRSGSQSQTGAFLALPRLLYPKSNPCARLRVLMGFESIELKTMGGRPDGVLPASDAIIV
jgi:hypothetical protein